MARNDESINQGLADALNRIAEYVDPAKRAEETKKALRPQNIASPRISVLNPRGDKDFPRPKLKFAKLFIPWQAEPEDFTREEIELLNLMEQGEYMVERNDGTKRPLQVFIKRNELSGKPEILQFRGHELYSNENKQIMPPLVRMLRQILGEKAAEVMTMAEEQELVDSGVLSVSQGG